MFCFQAQGFFERVAVRLVHLEADVGFFDPVPGDGKGCVLCGDLFDADDDVHGLPLTFYERSWFTGDYEACRKRHWAGVELRRGVERRGFTPNLPSPSGRLRSLSGDRRSYFPAHLLKI